jgi:hypothetical protein
MGKVLRVTGTALDDLEKTETQIGLFDRTERAPQRKPIMGRPRVPFIVSTEMTDEKTVVKSFLEPRFVAGTLFLDPQTPEVEWRPWINRGNFDEVYVSVTKDSIEHDIGFARNILLAIREQFSMADPVVIGPVNSEVSTTWHARIRTAGLNAIELDAAHYLKDIADAARFRQKRNHRTSQR